MLRRARLVMTAVAAVLAVFVLVLSIVQVDHYDHQRTTAASVPAPLAIGTALERPPKVPPVALMTAQGRRVTLSAWRGKWVVLAPSMTLGGEVCPVTTGALMQLQRQLRQAGLANQVAVMEATIDPWRDSPARLRAYQRLTGADFTMLTGSQAEIHQLWKFFGVDYRRVPEGKPPDIDWMTHKPLTFDIQHTDAVFIIDPAGQERIVDEGMPDVGGHLSASLRALLDKQGLQDLAHPQLPWTANEILQDLDFLMNRNVPASAVQKVSAPTQAAAAQALAGSPQPLAALHGQAGRLLAAGVSLRAELRALHGYPVVLNAWASWCGPCRAEFSLLASASATYGRRVAFLGNDTNDSAEEARTFLAQHPVSYPSLQASMGALTSLAQIEGLPTTIFINRAGHVVFVHTGSYDTQASLTQDIERYALGA
jgi:cytochrome oxidase Cu insertion factor (SCO1/SenC/PrrC family)/thiol-disulfide isomerase/thioredoxin